MAEQKPPNALVERIVKILSKNDGLTGLWFKDIGFIRVLNANINEIETATYDPSNIHDFLETYELAIKRQALCDSLAVLKNYIATQTSK